MTTLTELPYDPAAEGAVIGSMIVGPESIPGVVEHIGKDDFVREEAAELFEIVRERWRRNEPIDAVLVRSDFLNRPNKQALFDYLCAAMDNTPSACNAVYYARCVKKKSIERQLIRLVDEAKQRVTDPGEAIDSKLAAIAKLLTNCPGTVDRHNTNLCDLIDDYFFRGQEAG